MGLHYSLRETSKFTNWTLINKEHSKPMRVVYNAVLIPSAMLIKASCSEAELVTSMSVKEVPNISRNPVTVPTIPNAKEASAMNHPTSAVCS